MIIPNRTQPGTGLLNFRPPPKKVRASRAKSKADPTKQLLNLHRTEATPPRNCQIPPSGAVGDGSHVLGDQMFGFDSFGQIDLLGANAWSDECLSYNEDWMAPALTPLSPAREGWRDEVPDHPPFKLITGQPYQTGSIGEAITASNIDNVSAHPIPKFSGQHDLHFSALRRASNLITTPSLALPELAEDWLQLLQTGPLPPQAMCQTAPVATTRIQSSSTTHQNGPGKLRPSAHEVEAEQHRCDTRRYTDTGIPGQHYNTNIRSMTNTPEPQTSISEITNKADKRISVSAPAPFCVQLPSPQPTEQTSQRKTSPPKTPLPTATTAPSGPRRSARVNTGATKLSHDQLGPKKHAPQKRLYVEIYADGDAIKDSRGARTAKRSRLTAVHSSTPAGRADQPLDKSRPERRSPLPTSEDEPGNMTLTKPLRQPLTRTLAESPGAKQQELVRPQSRQDLTSRGDSHQVHGHGRFQDPRARPAKPIHIEASRGIPSDCCSACGFHAEHLLQLSERACRWISKDDASFEALFEGGLGFSDTDKSAIMLRLCLGSIRDYALEMAMERRQPGHPLQHTMKLPEYTDNKKINDPMSGQGDSLSDSSNDDDLDDLSEDTETGSDSEITDGVKSKQQARGKALRWSPLEERRLRSYVKENKDWSWIAGQLGRTENAVKQHWGKMS